MSQKETAGMKRLLSSGKRTGLIELKIMHFKPIEANKKCKAFIKSL